MKKLLVCLVFLVLISGCKTEFIWDPTGTWIFTIAYYDGAITYPDTFTFTGTDASGTVTGLTIYGVLTPQTGTYTKTGDYTLTLHFDFMAYGDHLIFDFLGTSTEVDPNSMTGTGEWYMDGPLFSSLTFTAVKTTNLQ